MRTITVFDPKMGNDRIEITTAATTFGEIKSEISHLLGEGKSAKIVVDGSPQGVVTGDDHQLPTGDFTILIMTTKMKAGK